MDPARLPVLLDGEIVALDRAGRPDFRRLQQRANLRKEHDVARARARVQVDLMLFDVLVADGTDVTDRPWTERRDLLESLVTAQAPVHVPPVFDGDLDAALQTSRALRLEGVVAKRHASTYAGRRSREWLKLKHQAMQEVVVVGWRPGKADPAVMGSLLMAVPDPSGGLRYVGRVGTGFTERERRDITARLRSLERRTPGVSDVPAQDASDARWVTPRLVGEVTYADWAEGADGASGERRMRHSVWRGWRPDRSPSDVTVELPGLG